MSLPQEEKLTLYLKLCANDKDLGLAEKRTTSFDFNQLLLVHIYFTPCPSHAHAH